MSVSQQVDQSPSTSIGWDSVIRGFGRQHELQFKETLQGIANRTSLQVACEVIGVTLSPSLASRYTAADLDILHGLGDFLWVRGHTVPRLMEYRRLEYVRRGRADMGFSLSREEYLKERAAGKSKNKIAQSQGISGPALFHWLDKWGLKDAAVEQQEMTILAGAGQPTSTPMNVELTQAALVTSDPVKTQASESPRTKLQVVSAEPSHGVAAIAVICPERIDDEAGLPHNHLHNHVMVDGLQVQFSLPLRSVETPETISVPQLSRDELMQTALRLMQGAIGQAYNDLATLLGEPLAAQQIQGYVEHQLQKFLSHSAE